VRHVAPVEEFPVDRWEHIVKTMLFGAFYLTRAALPRGAPAQRWRVDHEVAGHSQVRR
jgi:3-hydroxybutyrate dehydrogenase